MAIILPRQLVDLIGKFPWSNGFGLQRSHTVGKDFAENKARWLRNIGFNSEADFNLKPRPETMRGSAVMGVAAHNGNHVELIDDLKYDVSDPDSRKFMNVIERKQRDELVIAGQRNASASEIEGIKRKYRIEMMNAVDFWNTLELYPERLAQMGYSDLQSVALNRADPRTGGDAEALKSYLNQRGVTQQFDYDFIKAHPYFQEIEKLRGSAEIDIDRQLIKQYPVQGFIRNPDGEVIWTKDMRADALARDRILADYVDRNGRISAADFEAFEERVKSPVFERYRARIRAALDLFPDDFKPISVAQIREEHARRFPMRPIMWRSRKRWAISFRPMSSFAIRFRSRGWARIRLLILFRQHPSHLIRRSTGIRCRTTRFTRAELRSRQVRHF